MTLDCGQQVTTLTGCPRGNRDYAYCRDALINDAMIGNFQSNYYQMDPGNICLVEIRNQMSNKDHLGFWKIWRDERDLMFFKAPNREVSDDDKLERID